MSASGLSVQDIQEFENQLGRGDGATATAVISAISPTDDGAEGSDDLPQQYWSTGAMNARASAQLRSLDAQLEAALTDLGTLLTEQEVDALERAQRAWKVFRQRDMTFAASEYFGGSMASLVAIAHGAALTEQRIETVTSDLADRKDRYG